MAIVMVEISSNGSYCDACEWEGEWPTTTSTGDHVRAYCDLFQQLKALGSGARRALKQNAPRLRRARFTWLG